MASGKTRALLALLCASLAGVPACATEDATQPAGPRVIADEDLPIIGIVIGEYDGTDLTFRDATQVELDRAIERERDRRAAAGLAVEPLVDIPSMACGSGCTGTSYVGFTTVAGSRRRRVNGQAFPPPPATPVDPEWTSADVGNCGPVPSTGVCSAVRVRNMYNEQLERVYVEIVELTATPPTFEPVVIPSSQPNEAVADFGLSPTFANGLWRYGEIARRTSVAGSPSLYWAFTGSTPMGSNFEFSFTAQVRGLVASPTRRGSIATGQRDVPGAGAYSAQTSINPMNNSHVAISDSGEYVAFAWTSATGTMSTIYRKNLATGTLDSVATGCPSASFGQPHISSDGTRVVFQARSTPGMTGISCDPSGEGSSSTSVQIYLHDFTTSTTTLVSHNAVTGAYAAGNSQQPRISADGSTVVFHSTALDLTDPGAPTRGAGCLEAYRYEVATGLISHVSAVLGTDAFDPAAGYSALCTATAEAGQTPDVSGDGNLVVFATSQPLDPGDSTPTRDIYVYDHAATQATGVNIVYRVSLTRLGAAMNVAATIFPSISSDGAFVAFNTAATNISASNAAGTMTAGRVNVYRRSSAEGADSTILRVSQRADTNGEGSGTTTGIPALSSTGRFVSFWSAASDLAAISGRFSLSGLATTQLYVCDMRDGTEAASPVDPLTRCYVASTVQPDAAAGSAFNPLCAGSAFGSAVRVGLAQTSDIDTGYVAYLASASSSGACNWSAMSGTGFHVFVSPVGDPRYQYPATGP